MRRVRINNPLLDKSYRTFLDSDYSSGTTLTVVNNISFTANDFLIIGEPREEKTEQRQLSSVAGNTTITINSAFRFAHPKGSSIYKTYWDNISIERRTSSAGTFAEITETAIQWDNKDNETVYYDQNATDNYEYRFRFRNTSTLEYSEYSPTITGAAPERNTVRYMLRQVRLLTGDTERKLAEDEEIIRAFNIAQDIIYTHNPKYWFLYADTFEAGSGSIAATAGEDVYTLNNLTRYGHLAGIKYRYNSSPTDNIYRLKKITEAEFDRLDSDQNITDDNWPEVYKQLPGDSSSTNGYFKITPDIKDSGIGTFYPIYYEKMANLDSVDDTTQVPLPDLLIDFAVGFVYKISGNERKAGVYQSNLISENAVKLPPGLAMLDSMDNAQRDSIGQPKSISRFRGQKAINRLYGNRNLQSTDYIRENYFVDD